MNNRTIHYFMNAMCFAIFRGESGPCGMVISPIDGQPNQCQLKWFLNTNLKVR